MTNNISRCYNKLTVPCFRKGNNIICTEYILAEKAQSSSRDMQYSQTDIYCCPLFNRLLIK